MGCYGYFHQLGDQIWSPVSGTQLSIEKPSWICPLPDSTSTPIEPSLSSAWTWRFWNTQWDDFDHVFGLTCVQRSEATQSPGHTTDGFVSHVEIQIVSVSYASIVPVDPFSVNDWFGRRFHNHPSVKDELLRCIRSITFLILDIAE